MNNKTINIAYCTDANYLEYVATSITSVIMNNVHIPLAFYVFVYDVCDSDIERLRATSPLILVIEIDKAEIEKYQDNFTIKHLNRSVYMRLAVPRLLAGKVDKFIYLDADTLCFSDISGINKINIDEVICAVSHDSLDTNNNINAQRLNIQTGKYFNSGFLYINIGNWIANEVERKANLILFEKGETLPYPDQDALNIAMCNNFVFIDNSWNYIFNWYTEEQKETFFYVKEKLPRIIHFTGGRKPWFKEHDGLSQQLFLFYHHFTPWKNIPLRSYQERMRPTDYRVYARKNWRQGKYLQSIKWYIKYLYSRLL
jgi:lipopolysaccharide biosynthesis glycosyltransferase